MASKGLLVFALLLAAAFLIAAAEETQAKKEETKDAYYGGDRGYPDRGGRGFPYPGRRGGGGGGNPGGGGGGYCRWGCCGRGYFFRGCRCCASADDVPEPMYRPEEVHN
ncbi:hypothetical protein GUJ93_ZPchr0002g23512 [Zizania palustris]|uniref:Glycine-rich protein n=1 Tax=Zizania palustris TaxID=103762 RepID=A0A8J5RVP7_ZIZPA|nr:hypothetical protein GUJ93_ZPchr0002g23512 [Zizania palustris]